MKAGLVLGEWQFGSVGEPGLYDPVTGTKKHMLDGGISGSAALAGDGRWVVIRAIQYKGVGKGSVWTLSAVDINTGKLSTGLDVSKSSQQVENASVRKDVVSVVAKNRELLIGKAPG
jgi:hypothetical protein